jgi:hypothetical protein
MVCCDDLVHKKLVLQQFEDYGGIVVRNAMYGSSGFVNIPKVILFFAMLFLFV